MTLIEAASSSPDRRIRRMNWGKDKDFQFSGNALLYCDDAIADDWEPILPDKKTVKKKLYQILVSIPGPNKRYFISDNVFETKEKAESFCIKYDYKLVRFLVENPIEIEVEVEDKNEFI